MIPHILVPIYLGFPWREPSRNDATPSRHQNVYSDRSIDGQNYLSPVKSLHFIRLRNAPSFANFANAHISCPFCRPMQSDHWKSRRQCDMHCSLFGKLIPHISWFASFFISGALVAGALCSLRVNRMQIFQHFIEFIRLVLFTLAFIHSQGARARVDHKIGISHGTRLMLTRERFIRIDFMKYY